MAGTAGKKKFKFDFVLDFTKYEISWLKFDFKKSAQDKVKTNREISRIVKPIKFKVEAELDEAEWDEKRILEDGYCQFRGSVKVLSERIDEGADVKEIEKQYKSISSQAEKVVTAWLKKEASGAADNEKGLKAGAKALEGMKDIDPDKISTEPRNAAITALAPLLKADADERAKTKAAGDLKSAHDEFKKNGGGVKDAVKALLDAGKKIKANSKSDASLKSFGAKILKDKAIFKTMSTELEALSSTLEEVCKLADDGKLDDKGAKKYTDMLKNLKSLDGSVDKGFSSLEKYSDDFEEIADKLSK